jgi:hypothetical protein
MALSTTMFCPECAQNKDVIINPGHPPSMCYDCENKLEKERVDTAITELKTLTLEERIERLERLGLASKPHIHINDMLIGGSQ